MYLIGIYNYNIHNIFLLFLLPVHLLINPLDYFIGTPVNIFLSLNNNYILSSRMFDFDIPFIVNDIRYNENINDNSLDLNNSILERNNGEYTIKIGRYFICSTKNNISVGQKCFWELEAVIEGYLLKRQNKCLSIREDIKNKTLNLKMENCSNLRNMIFYFKRTAKINKDCDLSESGEESEETEEESGENKEKVKEENKEKKRKDKKKSLSKKDKIFKEFLKKNPKLKKSKKDLDFFKKLNSALSFKLRFNLLNLFCYN